MPLMTFKKDKSEAFDADHIALARTAEVLGASFQAVVCEAAKLEISTLAGLQGRACFLFRRDMRRIEEAPRENAHSLPRINPTGA